MALVVTRAPIALGTTAAQLIELHCADILASPGMRLARGCVQHGSTSVFEHSLAVTLLALSLAIWLRIPVDERALTRGTLLHDYFLYDWHGPHPDNQLHGFRHPFTACRNAIRDFDATPHEQAIIKTHMFPLVPLPPSSREAALTCLADKIVATRETVSGMLPRLGLRASR